MLVPSFCVSITLVSVNYVVERLSSSRLTGGFSLFDAARSRKTSPKPQRLEPKG